MGAKHRATLTGILGAAVSDKNEPPTARAAALWKGARLKFAQRERLTERLCCQ